MNAWRRALAAAAAATVTVYVALTLAGCTPRKAPAESPRPLQTGGQPAETPQPLLTIIVVK